MAGAPRLTKLPPMADYQFFDRPRLEALVARENELYLARRDIEIRLKAARERRPLLNAIKTEIAGKMALPAIEPPFTQCS